MEDRDFLEKAKECIKRESILPGVVVQLTPHGYELILNGIFSRQELVNICAAILRIERPDYQKPD